VDLTALEREPGAVESHHPAVSLADSPRRKSRHDGTPR